MLFTKRIKFRGRNFTNLKEVAKQITYKKYIFKIMIRLESFESANKFVHIKFITKNGKE